MNPRYNARDATWWFLQALQDYAKLAPDGKDVFKWQVPRLFPSDDQRDHERKYAGKVTRPTQSMEEIVMEIMTKHANGIHFVEWNAGTRIDSVMNENGFHIDIITDWNNGFILGGNQDNCGTWMDKMGSSEKAGKAITIMIIKAIRNLMNHPPHNQKCDISGARPIVNAPPIPK